MEICVQSLETKKLVNFDYKKDCTKNTIKTRGLEVGAIKENKRKEKKRKISNMVLNVSILIQSSLCIHFRVWKPIDQNDSQFKKSIKYKDYEARTPVVI
ncbi:hypothetical protein BpHYR1_044841 [Brachionus plicatilis]|uniref:Uncharacterized protein n=1 Tax=Brachionus plicatilis TaxID=10195 RepID=A0A3M7RBJ8_BRAPC|nr:hypothetical protein BpHYR1_044841 [Brachionus plicatilis]